MPFFPQYHKSVVSRRSYLQGQRTCINHQGELSSLDQLSSNSSPHQNHVEGLLKCRSLGPTIGFWFSRPGEWPENAFLTRSPLMLMLLVPASHFENHRPRQLKLSFWVSFSQAFFKFNVHMCHLEIPLTGLDSVGLGGFRYCVSSQLSGHASAAWSSSGLEE